MEEEEQEEEEGEPLAATDSFTSDSLLFLYQ